MRPGETSLGQTDIRAKMQRHTPQMKLEMILVTKKKAATTPSSLPPLHWHFSDLYQQTDTASVLRLLPHYMCSHHDRIHHKVFPRDRTNGAAALGLSASDPVELTLSLILISQWKVNEYEQWMNVLFMTWDPDPHFDDSS